MRSIGNLKAYIIPCFSFLIFSCSDKSCCPEEVGTASCIINNDTFDFKCSVYYNSLQKDTLYISLENFNGQNYLRKRLTFSGLVCFNGVKYLNNIDSPKVIFVTRLSDGDVAGNYYQLMTNDSIIDYIEIILCNKNEVEGIFNGSFLLSPPRLDTTFPDTLNVSQCKFKGYLH